MTTSANRSVNLLTTLVIGAPSGSRVSHHRLIRDAIIRCYPMTGQAQGIFLCQPGPFGAARSNGYPKGISVQMFFHLYRSEIPRHIYLHRRNFRLLDLLRVYPVR